MIEWVLLYAIAGLVATILFLLWVVNGTPAPRRPLDFRTWCFIGLVLFFGIILWVPFATVYGTSYGLDKILQRIEIHRARKYVRDYNKTGGSPE